LHLAGSSKPDIDVRQWQRVVRGLPELLNEVITPVVGIGDGRA
jgi:hypothetical protein